MLKKLSVSCLCLLALILPGQIFGQDLENEPEVNDNRCATVEMDARLRQVYPQLGTTEEFEAWLSEAVLQTPPSDAVTTIPVVFHVIHDGESVGTGDNISNTYLNAQIDQLNNDFRRISGTSGYNTHSDGADTEVQFVLDSVNRIDRDTMGWSAPPYSTNYVENTIKGDSYWDPDDYFNIWVCDMQGGILGYAQFPSQSGLGGLSSNEGPASTDGVVVLTSSVGSTVTPYPGGGAYNKGRTLTHEVGHWLGLRHIWGDGGCGVDDYVSDTPTSDAANFGCPTTHVSCSSTDMVRNYMDYTDDSCMNIFTNGQKSRIQTVLANALRRQFGGGGPGGGGCSGGISSFPYSESFESGTGAWTQASGDNFDWTRRSGGTPSSGTGPSSASAGSWYMYVESSSPNYSNKTTIFNGPCFDLSGESSATFGFDYHMYGSSNMGDLSLQASTDGTSWSTLWTRSGNQGNSWQTASVSLASYLGSSVQLRYVGVTGTTWQGDMAIDDLSLTTSGGGSGGTSDFTLTLNFDNYPEETSWALLDGSTTVASGGTYGSQPDGSTLVQTITVADGCYTFVIYDSYGDGICCSYGVGSYTVETSAGVVASGGSFGYSDSTTVCTP
jgi:hypothetical protein